MSLLPRLLFYWLPAIGWTALILIASGNALSAGETGFWLDRIIRAITGREPDSAPFEVLHVSIRKAAHIVEYAVLSFLFFRAVRAERPGWRARWAWSAVLLCVVVSIADESLQGLTAARSGTPWDVALDLAAIVAAQWLPRRQALNNEPAASAREPTG